MKNRIVFSGLFILFIIEISVLIFFSFSETENLQDTIAVNEVMQTVQNDWNSIEQHFNHTSLDYVVLSLDESVLYKTKSGLSENINAAISHKDTILDIEIDGYIAGKLIVFNNDASFFQSEKQSVILIVITAVLLQLVICTIYFIYIRRIVIKPFYKLKEFAKRIAGGNLDIPLQMDRGNLFGAFTESFDIMRSELKKAKIAEAKANDSKKELVAKLSHDIKTPIASIKAASEVGAALSYDEKSKENYYQIIHKADHIDTLISNLFSATLEELHELSVTPSYIESKELHTLLENADYLHRTVIPQIPDCVIYADKLRLQQVFDNIFANSYKYADTEINTKVYIESNYINIVIEDFGGGINALELPLIKRKFKRGSNTKDIEGAGLGLYIADYCINKMSGSLDVENGSNGLKVIVRITLGSAI